MTPTGFLIMGVSGSGKTTVGETLAQKLGWDFYDADDFHPAENTTKKASGIQPSDSDRAQLLYGMDGIEVSYLRRSYDLI